MNDGRSLVKARLGISLFFFTNGMVLATILPRYPEIKSAFALGNTAYGLLVASVALGSISAVVFPAPLIKRFGAQSVSLVGTLLLASAMIIAGFATNVYVFVAVLAAVGFLDACIDATQNVHGVKVEDARGKTIINSLHALWSLGASLGGGIGAGAAWLKIPLSWHLFTTSLLVMILATYATYLARLPETKNSIIEHKTQAETDLSGKQEKSTKTNFTAWKIVILLGLLMIAGVLTEDVASNWAALFLKDTMGASLGVAGTGYVILIGSQFVGRIFADPLTDSWGVTKVVRAGGIFIALGGILISTALNIPLVMLGYALAGYGCAAIVPSAYAAAGRIRGISSGAGIAVVGWMLRVCFLVASPLIGLLSDLFSLAWALSLVAFSGILVLLLAPVLQKGE